MISAATTFTNDRFPRATTPDLRQLRRPTRTRPRGRRWCARARRSAPGCTIGCDLTIGRFAMVGMGSLVTRSVPDFHLVLGSPARSVGCVCRCGQVVARFEGERAARADVQPARVCGLRYRIDGAGEVTELGARRLIRRRPIDGALGHRRRRAPGHDAGAPAAPARRSASRCSRPATGLGGLASAWSLGDVVWDRHYHVILLSDSHLRALLAELGLAGETALVETQDRLLHRRRAVLDVERARVPALSAARPGGEAAAGGDDPPRLAHPRLEAARARARRRLAAALVGTRDVSRRSGCRCCAPSSATATRGPRRRSSGPRSPGCTPRGAPGSSRRCSATSRAATRGSSTRFTEVLREAGVEIELAAPARGGRARAGGGVERQHSAAGVQRRLRPRRADRAGAARGRALVPRPRRREEVAAWRGIEYVGIVCASLLSRRPLVGLLHHEHHRVLGAVHRGDRDVGAGRPRAVRRQHAGLPAEVRLAATTRSSPAPTRRSSGRSSTRCGGMHPQLSAEDVLAFRVSRARTSSRCRRSATPSRCRRTATSIPGVHIVNSAHIVNGTLNVNETIQLAERDAALALPEARA